MRPFRSIVLSRCINFAEKVFCEGTHFEEKFSLDAPILSVHGRMENRPEIPQQQQQQQQHQQQQQEEFPLPDLSAAPQIKSRGNSKSKRLPYIKECLKEI